jgi:Cu(I)/Ag(I) efflux system periplasmic protein CusF
MKQIVRKFVCAATALVLTIPAWALDWASGEIRRVDPQNQRLTIKHGEIKSLDMPPMTMVFHVKDAAILQGLQAQDRIEFQASAEGTKYIVTQIRKVTP